MQKELNPELFGEVASKTAKSYDLEGQTVLGMVMRTDQKVVELKDEIREIRTQINSVIERIGQLVGQMNEYIKSTQIRFDGVSKQVNRLDRNDQALSQDTTEKVTQLQTRLGDRRVMDLKIHEMLERHNGIIRSYEVRLNQLQKLIAEKEAQTVAAQAALNEAKMEISRLKRL